MQIKVQVNTNSKQQSIIETNNNELLIRFYANRDKGEANKKLIEILSKHYRLPKANIKIVSGFTSTSKVIDITDYP